MCCECAPNPSVARGLEPGGYFEIHDNCFPISCDDHTLTPDCSLLRWTQLLIQATDMIGRHLTVSPRFKDMMREAGFEDVVELRFKWPINTWPRDQRMKQLGFWSSANAGPSIEAITLALFTRVLGWSEEDTKALCREVVRDLRDVKIHAYWDV